MLQTVKEALATIDQQTAPLEPITALLSESQGLILAQPVHMDIDSPPFDRSLLDGFACRAIDVHPGARLSVIATHHAGSVDSIATKPLQQGQCVAINTGAILPPSADAVLMVEHTRPTENPTEIESTHSLALGTGIQRRAADAGSGQLVLPANIRLGPAQLAIAAAADRTTLSVFPLPALAILTTGDELVDPSQLPGPTQIRNSNRPLLLALASQFANFKILDLDPAPDEAPILRDRLTHGLAESDLLIVTGGMSMGTRDLVPTLLQELGLTLHIQKVAMKPGKPFLFATLDTPTGKRKYVAGLPGNPVSAFVTFHLFVKQILRRLTSTPATVGGLSHAITDTDLPENGNREFYQPATLTYQNAQLVATPLPWTGSANLYALAAANALIIRPINGAAVTRKSLVPILPL